MVVEIPSYADTLPSSAAASSRVIFDSAEHECGASHHIPRVLMAVRARRDTHTHTHTRAHTHTHTHTHNTDPHTLLKRAVLLLPPNACLSVRTPPIYISLVHIEV
eukprot:GHVU01036169.1.p1 GENE.GHVU01036169.1~~GHVU01036169.1.p1  ORF type:complete len:105 (+),score=8.23 GHVU01036169.1:375-689(+)